MTVFFLQNVIFFKHSHLNGVVDLSNDFNEFVGYDYDSDIKLEQEEDDDVEAGVIEEDDEEEEEEDNDFEDNCSDESEDESEQETEKEEEEEEEGEEKEEQLSDDNENEAKRDEEAEGSFEEEKDNEKLRATFVGPSNPNLMTLIKYRGKGYKTLCYTPQGSKSLMFDMCNEKEFEIIQNLIKNSLKGTT